MHISEIRRFKDSAIDTVEDTLHAVSLGTATLETLEELMNDPTLTDVVLTDVEVPCGPFASKYEMACAITETLSKDAVRKLLADENVWPWLSIAFRTSVFPTKKFKPYVGDLSRHVIRTLGNRSNKAYHRHLVRGAVNAVLRFKEDAKGIMAEPSVHTTFEEQIMSRQEKVALAGSPEFVKAVNVLYFDANKGAHKRNAAKGKFGSIMRLIEMTSQLSLNYDITSLTANELIALLPKKEFGRFIPKAA